MVEVFFVQLVPLLLLLMLFSGKIVHSKSILGLVSPIQSLFRTLISKVGNRGSLPMTTEPLTGEMAILDLAH